MRRNYLIVVHNHLVYSYISYFLALNAWINLPLTFLNFLFIYYVLFKARIPFYFQEPELLTNEEEMQARSCFILHFSVIKVLNIVGKYKKNTFLTDKETVCAVYSAPFYENGFPFSLLTITTIVNYMVFL